MKVLVACEFSGIVRDAFAKRGHDAWSCDLLPTEKPGKHLQGDILHLLVHLKNPVSQLKTPSKYPEDLPSKFDLMIAHPPCTYLANSGVSHLYNKDKSINQERWQKMKDAAKFFRRLYMADVHDKIPRICIENPIMHRHGKAEIGIAFYQDSYPYKQVVQPWMFGHPEQKATCLWLVNLDPLEETNNVMNEMLKLPDNKRQRLHYLPPSKDRQTIRSRTFQGIADAMAEQWGSL